LGETIAVEVRNNQQETADLLQVVLNEDAQAAELLAAEVHREVFLDDVNTKRPTGDFSVCLEDLGIWIDPIDSTAEYINGIEEVAACGISVSGLKCVTVLIGAYDKKTGLPLVGVVNQPFADYSENKWTGLCFWGVPNRTSLPPAPAPSRTICVSSSENRDVTLKLERTGYKIVEASGAGYKILAVITGLADAYVLTRDSTFKWDTCGPQAILRALGGDVVVCSRVGESVTYGDSRGDSCNRGGVVAYKEPKVLEDIVKCLA
jgi:inositol polyphosphate 1-phosphatase